MDRKRGWSILSQHCGNVNVNVNRHVQCHMKLHLVALRYGTCLIGSHRTTCHPNVLYQQGHGHTWYLHPQSSTAVTHCLIIATHFTDPRERMIACVMLKSVMGVKPGPLTSATSVTTQPPAPWRDFSSIGWCWDNAAQLSTDCHSWRSCIAVCALHGRD